MISYLLLCPASHSYKPPSHNELICPNSVDPNSRILFRYAHLLFSVITEIFFSYCLLLQWLPDWPPSSAPSTPDILSSKKYFQNINVMILMVKLFTRSPSWSSNSLFIILWHILMPPYAFLSLFPDTCPKEV